MAALMLRTKNLIFTDELEKCECIAAHILSNEWLSQQNFLAAIVSIKCTQVKPLSLSHTQS